MSLNIGLDLDNTIINYNCAFSTKAIEYGWVKSKLSKNQIKETLLNEDGNDLRWQKLQSIVYSDDIGLSNIFDGVITFLEYAKKEKHNVYIISHKTKFSNFDPSKEFWNSAIKYLHDTKILDKTTNSLIKKTNIFFCPTLNEKIKKIDELQCDLFLDDLEQVVSHTDMPTSTIAIHFTPDLDSKKLRTSNWNDFLSIVINISMIGKTPFASFLKHFKNIPTNCEQIIRQGNNKLYKVSNDSKSEILLKKYFKNTLDKRNRGKTEYFALTTLHKNGITTIPTPYYFDDENQFAFYSFEPGSTIAHRTPSSQHLISINDFLAKIINLSQNINKKKFAPAAYPRFKINDYITFLEDRIDLIIEGSSKNILFREVNKFAIDQLLPFKDELIVKLKNDCKQLGLKINVSIPKNELILSPSDFGLHNMLLTKEKLTIIDFEYFGLDDPVKLLADFFHHVGQTLDDKFKYSILDHFIQSHPHGDSLLKRLKAIIDLVSFEWILIVLNIVTPGVLERRSFGGENNMDLLLQERFENAQKMLNDLLINKKKNNKYWSLKTLPDFLK